MQFQKLKKYKRVMEVPRFFLFTSNLTLPQHLKVSSFHGLTQGGTHAKKVLSLLVTAAASNPH